MAKISAKTRPNKASEVNLEGRMDETCLLVVSIVMQLGASIRASFAAQGITQLEPEGEPHNDFALAMAHMHRAAKTHEEELAASRGQPAEGSGGEGAGKYNGTAVGSHGGVGEVPDEEAGAEEPPAGGVPLERTTH